MPRGDGTGPMGIGPMSGRAAGYCAGFAVPGFANPIPGYGFGQGLGYGRGRNHARAHVYRGYRGVYPRAYVNRFFLAPEYPMAGSGISGGYDGSEEKAYLLEVQQNLERQIAQANAHIDYLGKQLAQVQNHLQELESESHADEKENMG